MTPELQAQADAAIAAEAAKKETPVVPAKEPVVPEILDLDVKPEAKKEISVQATGNEKIDSIGKLLASKGIATAQDIMSEYQKTGELSVATQATLVEGLGDHLASLVVRNLTETAQALNAESKAARTKVLEYANTKFKGEDAELTWSQVTEFAKSEESGLSTEDRQAMNALLAKGGLSAQLVIDKLASIYYGLPTTSTPADLLQGDEYAPSGFLPLNKTDYLIELRDAQRKYGYDSLQVQQLNTRREQSRQRGF